jgi:hypothetical protein
MPPLRERKDDVPAIAEHYARQYARKLGRPIRGVSPSAMEALLAYPWPGNIRELQNVIERAVILARGGSLSLPAFELPRLRSAVARPRQEGPRDERQQIEDALVKSRGRVSGVEGAAETLGVAASTLESRIHRLGIDKHGFRRLAGSQRTRAAHPARSSFPELNRSVSWRSSALTRTTDPEAPPPRAFWGFRSAAATARIVLQGHVVRRLNARFAGSWPGTGLLLMRLVVGAVLALRARSKPCLAPRRYTAR